ncbi:MAG: hypothetical protein C5B55_14335 [Blastocatellia bacterium]|nr:MAG: hypothetical protein C5B55_14335 [Blastocatellia bacterium]
MHEQTNVDVVKDAYRAISEHNFDVLLECFDENVKLFAIGPPHLIPTAGTRYGVEEVERYFALLAKTGSLKIKPIEFVSENDTVIAIGEDELDLIATGSSLRSPWVHVFNMRRGRISELRAFYDTAAMIEALDASDMAFRRRKQTPELRVVPAIF